MARRGAHEALRRACAGCAAAGRAITRLPERPAPVRLTFVEALRRQAQVRCALARALRRGVAHWGANLSRCGADRPVTRRASCLLAVLFRPLACCRPPVTCAG